MRQKGLFHSFYPDQWVDSAYDIDFETLYREGFRGLIFDIDNTLVHHGAPADDKAEQLFAKLHRLGFSCCLLSNNQLPRVKPFADVVGAGFIENAHKPSTRNYLEACSRMKVDVAHTVFIGDQLFTDVYGAKRCGMRNILVKPMNPKEEFQIVLKRKLERIVLHFYTKHLEKEKK